MPIQSLPPEVVHLIAAGEVIDSFAAVVRELVENALDAGASRITVSLWADLWKVRVVDNGVGIVYADLQQAATSHSTSKIHQTEDLYHITSLGFRGEALHSLAQLADLEICSRAQGEMEGWWMRYDRQGHPLEQEVVAIAPGSVVTVCNLFSEWVARRQSLPPIAQQLKAIQTLIQHFALCHPHVTWQVEQSDRPWFSIWAGSSAQQILPQCLRDVQPSDLQELILEADEALERRSGASSALYVLIGLPDRCHRYRPDWVKVAVNGRVVQFPALEQAIVNAFRRTLPRDRHPVCFLHLTLPPEQIDWNRHPAKTEIYLRDLETWQAKVTAAIAQALQQSPAKLPQAVYSERLGQLLKAGELKGGYGDRGTGVRGQGSGVRGQAIANSQELTANSQELTANSQNPKSKIQNLINRQPLTQNSPLKAIAQVHQMYILAEHPTGVWLIEQHIAHERVLYERLRDRWQMVLLAQPILLQDLSPKQVEQLQRIGVPIEPFGDATWAVRSVPEPLVQREDCSNALLELSLGGDLEAALVATACRTAIRNGMSLSLQEMQTLLDQWQQTQNPRTCPHGRPICLSLEESSLSRFFRRHWVIGKSHGI